MRPRDWERPRPFGVMRRQQPQARGLAAALHRGFVFIRHAVRARARPRAVGSRGKRSDRSRERPQGLRRPERLGGRTRWQRRRCSSATVRSRVRWVWDLLTGAAKRRGLEPARLALQIVEGVLKRGSVDAAIRTDAEGGFSKVHPVPAHAGAGSADRHGGCDPWSEVAVPVAVRPEGRKSHGDSGRGFRFSPVTRRSARLFSPSCHCAFAAFSRL